MLPKKLTSSTYIALVLLLAQPVLAQDNSEKKDQTLNGQYKTLIESSESYTEYKVIKKTELTNFWKMVSDSIRLDQITQKESYATIKTREAQIEDLNKTIESKNAELATGEEEKTSITVLGGEVNKSTYAVISIIIPVALLVFIGVLMAKLKSNILTTNTAVKEHANIETEFDDYKKKALETQMKLKRELQTERNKLSEVGR